MSEPDNASRPPVLNLQSRQPFSRSRLSRNNVSNQLLSTSSSINHDHSGPPDVQQLTPADIIRPQPFVQPALRKQQHSQVLRRPYQASLQSQAIVTDQSQTEHTIASTGQPSPAQYSKVQMALITMACLVFGLGLLASLETLQTNHNAQAQVAALSAKSDSSDSDAPPSETKPSQSSFTNYAVAPQLPKYLKIPTLGVDARVMSVGITKTGALGTPNNIYDTAWYNASARPGDAGSNGAILIDGHVHGPTLPGVFANIKKLQAGDTIQIVRGDNKVFTYTVKKVQNYDASSLNTGMLLTSIQPGEPGLNLVTCGGPFDKVSGEYTQRTVVFAVQS